jgi:hypothetical protein
MQGVERLRERAGENAIVIVSAVGIEGGKASETTAFCIFTCHLSPDKPT